MKHISLSTLCLLILFSSACEFTNVLDVEPADLLPADQAIRDTVTAEFALNGIYEMFNHSNEWWLNLEIIPSLLSGASEVGVRGGNLFKAQNNNLDPSCERLEALYLNLYTMINRANNFIYWVEALEGNTAEFPIELQTEMLAEARFLRGLAHFYLLRSFGQFNDMNSSFGNVLRLVPSNLSNRIQARSSVSQSYDVIISNLDYAIQHGPSYTSATRASRESAKALKAKVLLYMKEYQDAATLAAEVLEDGTFQLEETFAEVFDNGYSSKEGIFVPWYDSFNSKCQVNFFHIAGQRYREALKGDPRDSVSVKIWDRFPDTGTYKCNFRRETGNENGATYLYRLPELYLIYAEALLRSGGDPLKAQAAINTIRQRAGAEPVVHTDSDSLLAAIQHEKLVELGMEAGEEWFDMIRFGNVIELKPTVTREDQFIMPIPQAEINASDGVVVQNPGY